MSRSAGRLPAIAAGWLVFFALAVPNAALAADVSLAWDPSSDPVAGYRIYYRTQSESSYTHEVDVGNQTSGMVSGLTAGVRYYFVVRAYTATGLLSAPSNEVNGVVGEVLSFTDDPLLPGVHAMKAVHITELRSRIDALRTAQKLAPFNWAALAPGTLIRASHVTEMRTALGAVFAARKLPAPAYLDPALSAGMAIKALHITQLRAAVTALE